MAISCREPGSSTEGSQARYERVLSNNSTSCRSSVPPPLPARETENSNGTEARKETESGGCVPGGVYISSGPLVAVTHPAALWRGLQSSSPLWPSHEPRTPWPHAGGLPLQESVKC